MIVLNIIEEMNKIRRPSRSNEGILFLETVHTSSPWRPQLPLPKEVTMEKMEKSSKKDTKKWSFGGFFRKKKKHPESESSSEEDRKAGFIPQKRKNKTKKNHRSSKLIGAFDHIVINPLERFKETDSINSSERVPSVDSSKSYGSIDRRIRRDRAKNRIEVKRNSSSDEDSHNSLNSSTLSRFKSDESLGNNSGSLSKRTRGARTDRYLKRLSKEDGGTSPILTLHPQPQIQSQAQPQQHQQYQTQTTQPNVWKPQQTNSNYGSTNSMDVYSNQRPRGIRNSLSLTHVPQIVNGNRSNVPNTRSNNYPKPTNGDIRNLNNENIINQSLYLKDMMRSPPIPPPRDPQRRITLNSHETRPMSYAFDRLNTSQNSLWKLNNRCVSDDKLWGPQPNLSIPTPLRPSSVQPIQQKRFITRHESDTTNNSSFNNINPNLQQGYKYMADIAPRSRRPIHIVEDKPFKKPELSRLADPQPPTFIMPNTVRPENVNGVKSPSASASDFWKRIDQAEMRRNRPFEAYKPNPIKPRSQSTSRAPDMLSFTRVYHQAPMSIPIDSKDTIDNVLRSNMVTRPSRQSIIQNGKYTPLQQTPSNYKENIIPTQTENKSNSMPNYYASKKAFSPPLNKYEEYVARHKTQPNIHFDINTIPPVSTKPINPPPPPPQRSVSKRNSITDEDLTKKQKSANLEDAINELEAIYKSLRLCDEDLLDRAEKRDVPTPTKFNSNARILSPEYDDDDEEETGEPDIVLDDLVYRNIKHANSNLKTKEPQPLFGIPIGPIPPPPGTDYLNVTTPEKNKSHFVKRQSPDLVADDLAFRTLRKDNGLNSNFKLEHYVQPNLLKKKRAMRSMSANIYNLIHRDAAKPNGGHLDDYFDLDKALEKAGSLTDLNNDSDNDHPSTLWLLKKNRRQERADMLAAKNIQSPPANKGGAVFNLPSTLKTSPPSLPFISRKSPIASQKPPIPISRKSVSPEIMTQNIIDKNPIEDVLAALSREAQATSDKLGQDLIELRRETRSVSNSGSPEIQKQRSSPISNKKIELKIKKPILCQKINESTNTLNEIDEVSKAARLCEDILNEVVKDRMSVKEERKVKQTYIEPEIIMRKTPSSLNEDKLLNDIDKVSSSAKVCEKFLMDVVSPDMFHHEKLPVATYESKRLREIIDKRSNTIDNLVAELKPESKKIGEIANRCMKQLDNLNDIHEQTIVEQDDVKKTDDEEVCLISFDTPKSSPKLLIPEKLTNSLYDGPDYDNLNTDLIDIGNTFNIDSNVKNVIHDYENLQDDSVVPKEITELPFANVLQSSVDKQIAIVEDIDKIIREAAAVIKSSEIIYPPQSPLKQSSEEEFEKIMKNSRDCINNNNNRDLKTQSSSDFSPHKSSSATPNRNNSSSITSFNAMSSSDYIKSPSSEYQQPSECIKSTSTTSYEVKSSSVTPNPNEFSSFSNSPPSLALTPLGDCSQYNSSEELAMIFGITPTSPTGKSEDLMCAPEQNLSKHGLNSNFVESQIEEFKGQINNLDTILETHEEFCDDASFNSFSFANNNNFNNNLNNNNNNNLITHDNDQCPDSGNASLSDNPFTPNDTKQEYLYKNEIQINVITNNKNIIKEEISEQNNLVKDKEQNIISDNISNNIDKKVVNIKNDTILSNCSNEFSEQNNNSVKKTNNNKFTPINNENNQNNKLRERRFNEPPKSSNEPGTASSSSLPLSSSSSPPPSSSSSLLNNTQKSLTHRINVAHILLACTYGLANNEILSIIAIIIAIITLVAILML